MSVMEEIREREGATLRDEEGRYYLNDARGYRAYGYTTAWGAAYVCYTCGHLCECGEE